MPIRFPKKVSPRGGEYGGIALISALLVPLLLLTTAGAIELNFVLSDRRLTQDVADSAALMGARQLTVNSTGALYQAQEYALAQLTAVSARSNVTVSATQPSPGEVQVSIDTQRASFFLNLLPAGGFHTHSQSIAQAVNALPLCVLVFGDSGGNNLHLQDASQMQAGGCLVHSDKDIKVDGSAAIYAADTEAVGKASGTISPAANSNAPQIEDPFSGIDITFPSGCSTAPTPPGPGPGNGIGPGAANTLTIDGSTLGGAPYPLPPGLYCKNIDINNGAVVQMSAGEYYLGGNLTVEDTSTINGTDVALQFARNVSFSFNGNSQVSLSGRKSGKFAGFVILTTRDNQANFVIQSNHVSQLLGTIYVPNAQLQVLGSGQVAQTSAWTVVTALSMVVQAAPPTPGAPPTSPGSGPSSPTLVINANYSASDVPVPKGVGPGFGGSQLVR